MHKRRTEAVAGRRLPDQGRAKALPERDRRSERRTRTMQNAVHPTPIWADLAEMTHSLERRFGLSRLKRGMLAMLAGWLGYFFVVSMSVRALNKGAVPFLHMPPGGFLAAPGTAVIFLPPLLLLRKTSRPA